MSLTFRTIAIVGAGAIGTYYGVRLGRAGADVRFLLRSDLDAVRRRGSMLIHEREQTLELRPAAVFGASEEIGPVDLVIITMKSTGNRDLPRLLPPLIGSDTVVVPLQNGLGIDELIAPIVGPERVVGGLAFIASTRTGPGEVTCYHPGSITLGEYGRPAMPRTHALAAQLAEAGVKMRVVDDLVSARWHKLIWNIPFNGLAIVNDATTDRLCADSELAARVRRLMHEVQGAAAALGVTISDRFLQQQFEVTPPMGAYQPSSLVDFRAGREVEIEAIWGEPLRRAQAVGVDVPEMARLYSDLCSAAARR